MAVVRDSMWGFLLFAGVAWLAISWSVLRLEPAHVGYVAGPVVLFGALMEVIRALAGTATWWLNAGLASLFTLTGVLLLAGGDGSYTTPVALVGWFLMVRGAADIAVSMMTRETDRIWGLLLVVGVAEASLGFFAASPAARAADLAVPILGGLGLARGVADLVAALRLREAPRMSLLELPAGRAAGVAGYSAGLTDFDAAPGDASARHRAAPRGSSAVDEAARPVGASAAPGWPDGSRGADLGTGWNAGPAALPGHTGSNEEPAEAAGPTGPAASRTRNEEWARLPDPDGASDDLAGAAGSAAGVAGRNGSGSFHDEVLRTTADLDMMLALAGVTGAAVGAALSEHHDLPEVPDTPEGVENAEDSVSAHGGTAD